MPNKNHWLPLKCPPFPPILRLPPAPPVVIGPIQAPQGRGGERSKVENKILEFISISISPTHCSCPIHMILVEKTFSHKLSHQTILFSDLRLTVLTSSHASLSAKNYVGTSHLCLLVIISMITIITIKVINFDCLQSIDNKYFGRVKL